MLSVPVPYQMPIAELIFHLEGEEEAEVTRNQKQKIELRRLRIDLSNATNVYVSNYRVSCSTNSSLFFSFFK